MQWLIVAMGVLLMLVGAISVISGAPIIQIERGWTEVIAGAVAVSGGAVTFAIGIVLSRLQAWHQTLLVRGPMLPSEASRPAAAPVVAALHPPPVADAIQRDAPEPESPIAGDMAREEPAHPNLWKSVPEAGPARAVTVAAAGLAEAADDRPAAEDTKAAGLRATIAPDAEPAPGEDADTAARRLTFPASDRPPVPDVGRRPSTLSRDWMSRPLLRSRIPQPPSVPEPPPLFAGPSADLDEDRAPTIRTPRRGEEKAIPAPPIAAEPPVEPAPSLMPDISVVGRYQAGSSTYTMYSNGAIDVETQSGETHHFTSMDELKTFIARQENAVS